MTHLSGFFFSGGKRGETQKDLTVDLKYVASNCCTHVASARVKKINILVRKDTHMSVHDLVSNDVKPQI